MKKVNFFVSLKSGNVTMGTMGFTLPDHYSSFQDFLKDIANKFDLFGIHLFDLSSYKDFKIEFHQIIDKD